MQNLPTNTILQGGKYKIERVLGQGGFGITYLAVQTMLGRVVCIKEFFLKDFCTRTASGEVVNGMAASSEFVERYRSKFIKEARIISRFDHPNIIHVFDTFIENGTAYYVMEYIEGASLDEIIRRGGAMPEDKAVGYIKQVARALDYIHQRSVNHLDVKPANIMVSRSDNRAILIDFGVSKQYDEQGEQTSSTPIGISHGYAPIEQYRAGGVSTFSPQSDIYALGATLYKLITGNTPPQPSDIINDGLPQLPNNVSAELKNLIYQAMQIRKGDRPDSVDFFMRVSSQITNDAEDTMQVDMPEVSYSDAIQVYNEAQSLSKQGDTRAQEIYRRAFGMFLAVSLKGDASAQFYLAYCYSNGLGVEVDNDKAVEWYRRSAEQGNSSSQNNLGVCYSNGRGVNQDKAKAAEWYRKAAEQGNAYAQCNLADFYKDGIGVEKDLALAAQWYKKSADQQYERAMLALADCYYYGKGIEQNKEEAINIYKTLVGKGNEKAIEAIKKIEEEENHESWERSWKGRIYYFLEKPLKWLPSCKVLLACMFAWLAYILLKDGEVIKDYFGFSSATESTILFSYPIAMLFYKCLESVREIFKYNNNEKLRTIFRSFLYLIGTIVLIVVTCSISQSLSNVSDVSNQSIPIDKESMNVSQLQTASVEEESVVSTTTPLYVTTTPSGVTVYIDGNKVGTTPIEDKEISRGSHKVKLCKDGYQDKSFTRTFSDKPVVINETLAERPKPQPQQSSASSVTTSGNKKTYTVNGVSFTMVRVAGGTFTMGASSGDSEASSDEKPAHQVTLSSYSIGETEVTQALWQAVMGNNPSRFTGNLQRPVEKVSWNDCQALIRKLNAMTGETFRLPTEAEWEYAARGGSHSRGYKYSGSDNLGTVAWYAGNSSSTTHPVKGKQPNELGLYDMSGNVWEWCADWYDNWYYSSSPSSNPKGPSAGSDRVRRGGDWNYYAGGCRVSSRSACTPSGTLSDLGLRLVSQ